jgi:hypothetical protein
MSTPRPIETAFGDDGRLRLIDDDGSVLAVEAPLCELEKRAQKLVSSAKNAGA